MIQTATMQPLYCHTCGGALQFVRYAGETFCLHRGKSQMREIEPPANADALIRRAENDAPFHRSVARGYDTIVAPDELDAQCVANAENAAAYAHDAACVGTLELREAHEAMAEA